MKTTVEAIETILRLMSSSEERLTALNSRYSDGSRTRFRIRGVISKNALIN